MSTVGELVDRTYRDYLTVADDAPVTLTASQSAGHDGTSIAYTDSTLAPDEEDLLAPGVLVGIGTELMRITDVDADSNTLTVLRGVLGTTAADVSSGDEIDVAPMYPRQTVYDAVADNIDALYPSLWRTTTATITSASSVVDVPAEIAAVKSAIWLSSSRPVNAEVELLRNYPGSATGMGVVFYGTPSGKTVYLTYEARFTRPTSLDDDVATLGVDAAWERIVVVGAAAQALAGRDLDPVSQEYIVEQLERETFPAGQARAARDGLLRYHTFLLDQARKDLRVDRVPPVVLQR